MASKLKRLFSHAGKKTRTPALPPPPPRNQALPMVPEDMEPSRLTPENCGIRFRDPTFLTRFDALKIRGWTPPKYLEWSTLRALGVEEQVKLLVNEVELSQIFEKREYTFKGLTLEFLSTLHAHILSGDGFTEGRCTFQLGNQMWSLTFDEIAEIFSFTPSGLADLPKHQDYTYWANDNLWKYITEEDTFTAQEAKATPISHPAIRIFHKVLTYTVNARGDGNNNVSKRDFSFITAALRRKKLNAAAFLMGHLQHGSHVHVGLIAVGPVITVLARHFGLDVDRLDDGIAPIPLDFAFWLRSQLVYKYADQLYWRIGSTASCMTMPNERIENFALGRNHCHTWKCKEDPNVDVALKLIVKPAKKRRGGEGPSTVEEDFLDAPG